MSLTIRRWVSRPGSWANIHCPYTTGFSRSGSWANIHCSYAVGFSRPGDFPYAAGFSRPGSWANIHCPYAVGFSHPGQFPYSTRFSRPGSWAGRIGKMVNPEKRQANGKLLVAQCVCHPDQIPNMGESCFFLISSFQKFIPFLSSSPIGSSFSIHPPLSDIKPSFEA